jgi:membrane-associated HD superfamily phosphohydrolase
MKQIVLLISLGILVYFGFYGDNQWLSDVAKNILWIYSILIVVGLFGIKYFNIGAKPTNLPKFVIYCTRVFALALVFALIFADAFLMATVWVISHIVYVVLTRKDKKC